MSHLSARTAVRASYHLVRTPLTLFDDLVVERVFGADSTPHRVLAQGLERLDSLVDGETRADTPRPPSSPAASPEPAATKPSESAPAKDVEDGPGAPDRSAPAPAPETLPADEQEEITQLAEVFESEEELAPRAGELADNDELRRVQAEIKAKQAVEGERGQF